jgi:hypothetical protein
MRNILMAVGLMMSISLWAEYPMPYPVDTINGKAYYKYTVERSIGLYRISKNFGVTQEEILEANPEVQQHGLRYDEVILVPAKAVEKQEEKEAVKSGENRLIAVNNGGEEKNNNIDKSRGHQLPRATGEENVKNNSKNNTSAREQHSLAAGRKNIAEEKEQKNERKIITSFDDREENEQLVVVNDGKEESVALNDGEDRDTIRMAMMLPLMADAIKRDKNMDRFYDFYAGALIAIHEQQAKGQTIEVYTYDIGKNAEKIRQLLNDSTRPKVDAIIGPAYASQVAAAAEAAKRDSIPVWIPFAAKVAGIEENPYVYKFNPSDSVVADTLARYLKQYGDSVNCVVFESADSDAIPQSVQELYDALEKYEVPMTKTSLRALLTDSLEGSFAPDMENIVIFNTEKYSSLQGVMPHLLNAASKYPVTLYSRYSWQNEQVSLPQIYTSVFASEAEAGEEYKAVYEQYFGHELSSTQPRYDLLGYDLTSQVLDKLSQGEEKEMWLGVQSDIQYIAVGEAGGYENQMIHIIRK